MTNNKAFKMPKKEAFEMPIFLHYKAKIGV